MSLFSKLLGKKPEPETLDTKLERLKGASPAEVEALVRLNNTSTEAPLRLALVPQLSFGDALIELASSGDASHEVEKSARQRIAALVDKKELSFENVSAKISDTSCLLAIAALSSDPNLETQVLESITDLSVLVALCEKATSAAVRQAIVEKVEDEEALKTLSRTLKSKDKKAFKVVKAKLDAFKLEAQAQQEMRDAIAALIEEAEQHQKRSADKDYHLRVEKLQRRWPDVSESATAEETERFSNALKACEGVLEAAKAELEAERIKEQKISQADSERQKVLSEKWELIGEAYQLEEISDEALNALSEKDAALKQQWQELSALTKPSKRETKQDVQLSEVFAQVTAKLKEIGSVSALVKALEGDELEKDAQTKILKSLKRLIYPAQSIDGFELSAQLQGAVTVIEKLDSQYAAQREQSLKQVRTIGGMIKRAKQSVDQGKLKQAVGIRHSIDEKLEELDGVPANITRQIEELDEALQKLIDWQAYAVVPKKEALIKDMEALVGADLPPEALATKIKRLQDAWKGLRQSGSERNEDLWEKFSDLADKAYEPCKEFYDELGAERKQNLENRQTLVQQLNDFNDQYDWENADWKHVEKIVRGARSEIHSYAPVERAANKPVMEAFDQVMDKLHEKINAEQQKNKSAKEQIIMQAAKLADVADLQQAIETAKRLQNQWKTIGRANYKEDEKLWKDFRSHCDAVFEKKEKEVAERRAEADAHIAKGRACIDKLEALTKLTGDELLAARAERDAIQSEFSQIEEIPEKVERALQRDLAKASDKFDKMIEKTLNKQANEGWSAFFDLCKSINTELSTGDESKIESLVAEMSSWPESTESVIKQKMKNLEEAKQSDVKENEKALKILCIRSEILAEKETPASDKALRMEYQVNMLRQGLGANSAASNAKLDIALEWAKVGPVAERDYEALATRFLETWNTL